MKLLNFDCGKITDWRNHRVEISEIIPHAPTWKFFRQIDLQYNSLVKTLIWWNFCKKKCGNVKYSLSLRFFPWNQFFMTSSVKTLLSRNFWQHARVRVNFLIHHTVKIANVDQIQGWFHVKYELRNDSSLKFPHWLRTLLT